MSEALFTYMGLSIFAMRGHDNRYVIYHGKNPVTVITKQARGVWRDRMNRYSSTLTEAIYEWLQHNRNLCQHQDECDACYASAAQTQGDIDDRRV